jgi:hypothetical protein
MQGIGQRLSKSANGKTIIEKYPMVSPDRHCRPGRADFAGFARNYEVARNKIGVAGEFGGAH